jgi:uncharacterized membrane protein
MTSILILLAALGAGLVAGIFLAFSNFVMPALARLPPAQGTAAMQSINLTVLNPIFFALFFGTAALGLALAALALLGRAPGAPWLLAGALLYVAGCIGVTMAGNVPLNSALAALPPGGPEAARLWPHYRDRWTLWNTVRAAAALLAAAAFTLAWRA